MIQKATIEITVDTDKLGTEDWCSFAIKADPKVPKEVKTITAENFPAVLIAGKILELLTEELKDEKQLNLF